MADQTFSSFVLGASIASGMTGADSIPIIQDGVTKRVSPTLFASVNIIVLLGSSTTTGIYAAPGITAANRLIHGYATNSFGNSWVAGVYTLIPWLADQTNGWITGTDQIIDPHAEQWPNYRLIWLYK